MWRMPEVADPPEMGETEAAPPRERTFIEKLRVDFEGELARLVAELADVREREAVLADEHARIVEALKVLP